MDKLVDFYLASLQQMCNDEKAILTLLEESVMNVKNPALKAGIEAHHRTTEKQVKNLERIIESHGQKVMLGESPFVEGMEAARERFMIMYHPSEEVEQMLTLQASEKTEHYEIASYETLLALARKLKDNKAIGLLEDNLEEERRMAKIVKESTEKLLTLVPA